MFKEGDKIRLIKNTAAIRRELEFDGVPYELVQDNIFIFKNYLGSNDLSNTDQLASTGYDSTIIIPSFANWRTKIKYFELITPRGHHLTEIFK